MVLNYREFLAGFFPVSRVMRRVSRIEIGAVAGIIGISAILVVLWRVIPGDALSSASPAEPVKESRALFDLPPMDIAALLPQPSGVDHGPMPRFVNVAEAVGIQFTYFPDARLDRFFLPTNMGGGAAWLDFDGDDTY